MSWKSYKHRFIPWIVSNWSTRLINEVDTDVLKLKQVTALEQLEFVIHRLMDDVIKPRHFPLTPKSVKKLLSDSRGMKSAHDESTSVLYDVNKFSLEIRPSVLTGGGNGVFVSRGCVKGEQLVALYPGTFYLPYQPILVQSINNSFILRCFDGIHIDGKHNGLSRLIYKSCALRDTINSLLTCDLTWQTLQTPLNPLCIGQIINNQTRSMSANVEYIEIDIPTKWPLHYYGLIPNIAYGQLPDSRNICRSVAILAKKDINIDEELYSSYITVAR